MRRILRNYLLEFGDGRIEVFQTSKGVSAKDLRADMLRIDGQGFVGTCLGIFERPAGEQQVASLDLRCRIVRQQVRGAGY